MNGPNVHTSLPGPDGAAILDDLSRVLYPGLAKDLGPFVIRRKDGSWIEDVDGNVFLDFNAGIAVCSTGHAHPTVVEAVKRQADDLLHYSGTDFYLPIYSEVCEQLVGVRVLR